MSLIQAERTRTVYTIHTAYTMPRSTWVTMALYMSHTFQSGDALAGGVQFGHELALVGRAPVVVNQRLVDVLASAQTCLQRSQSISFLEFGVMVGISLLVSVVHGLYSIVLCRCGIA
jgi:hypothetical protein